jgi:hypothetical protein
MGLDFTYDRASSSSGGVEILKLHGSVNWLHCPNKQCVGNKKRLHIAPLQYMSHSVDSDYGYLQVVASRCQLCEQPLIPLIVPPAWGKDFDHGMLHSVWRRAADILLKTECFVGIGFSLSPLDIRIKQLLHVGFSSQRLRQALVVVGNDIEAEERWKSLFRQSWRESKLEVHRTDFKAATTSVLNALVIPKRFSQLREGAILPLPKSPLITDRVSERIVESLRRRGIECPSDVPFGGISWTTVADGMRKGLPAEHQTTIIYREVLKDIGCDWLPNCLIPAPPPTVLVFAEDNIPLGLS